MNPFARRAEPLPPAMEAAEPLELTEELTPVVPAFDREQWADRQAEERGAGGRHVLGTALAVLAALWLAFSAWSAGRSLGGQPLSSPAFAQWVAVAAGPLALLGLIWLMFGRTRRKEAERFTRSVAAMRTETRSLEALLEVLSQRIHDSRSELTMISQHLMQLGDQATGKLGGITREFDSSSERLKLHGESLDRAAKSARNDIAILLEDLPRAEQTARAVAEQLRAIGGESAANAPASDEQTRCTLAERTRETDQTIADAAGRLSTKLAEIETAGHRGCGTRRRSRSGVLGSARPCCSTARPLTLEQIRSGIDTQAAAVAALVEQASAGIGTAGAEASESLASNIDHANSSLEGFVGAASPSRTWRLAAHAGRNRSRSGAHRPTLHRTG